MTLMENSWKVSSEVMVITAPHVLRCAMHINRSKQSLMGELQGCHRNEQTIRLLIDPENVTLNSTAERDMQRKEQKEREAWGKLVYRDQRCLETLDA